MMSMAIPSLKNLPSKQRPAQIPLLTRIDHAEPSVFLPDVTLREARRQKNLLEGTVPEFCLLDSDGDIVDHVRAVQAARLCRSWACFHTDLGNGKAMTAASASSAGQWARRLPS